ncbi:xanthine dehydrogenase family protein molybdopterin-binding subunit [Streptomyces sp. NPDC057638]|uniref:xanthine dehydrogenase family protein molybdopterin-binding subunit n=1 Tax=Streptomyces sp. NPDC057638 TaxID=3346190 RepID=UPI00369BE62C
MTGISAGAGTGTDARTATSVGAATSADGHAETTSTAPTAGTATTTPSAPFVGRRMPRTHDPRLLRGEGLFVDDLDARGVLHAAVLRSPVPHGRVTAFDAKPALLPGGALLVLGPDDIAAHLAPLPTSWRLMGQRATTVPLDAHTVRHVGQPLGLVVARSRAEAEDLAEQVTVTIEPLPSVIDPEAALADGAPLVHPDHGTNLVGEVHFGDDPADLEAVFASAAHVVQRDLAIQRISHSPMEPRGVLAEWTRAGGGALTVWASTQTPHPLRRRIATTLGLRQDQVRVVAPDVGGGFGGKTVLQTDEALVCLAARLLGRRVKWIEDRRENLAASHQGRGQRARARLALDADGRFLALHARVTGDVGAFVIEAGTGPFQVTGLSLEGPYRFERAGATVTAVYTNTVPTGAYRGYGMQEAAWIRERLVEEAARETGRDPLALRQLNLLTADDLPHTTRTGLVYDSGDSPSLLRRAAELAERHRRPSSGTVRRGTAVTASVEVTGFAPSSLLEMFGVDWNGWEGARVRINHDGTVTVFAGVTAIGQGIETSLAQIAADHLGVPLDRIALRLGDTDTTPYSALGSQASRSLALAGSAVLKAATTLRRRMDDLAAHFLGVPGEDVTFDGNAFHSSAGETIAWPEVARRGWNGWGPHPADRAQLEESVDFDPSGVTYAYSAHGAAVAVDLETGEVRVEDYWAVNDSGVLVNPLIAEGQLIGGITQGIGLALLEEAHYDPATGQPLAIDLRDYTMPVSGDVPAVTIEHRTTPSTMNPGGFKGLGESGVIPTPATIANAVAAAVPEIAPALTATPLTPQRVWSLLSAVDVPIAAGDGGE